MRKIIYCILAILLISGLFLGCAKPVPKEIVLKAVTFLPTDREKMHIKGIDLCDRINAEVAAKYPGELRIEIAGGPEVIPSADQPIAVKQGTVDMALTAASYYEGLVPVADILMNSQVSLEEERSRGALDYVRELHEAAGFFALGRLDGTRQPFFYWSTTKTVTKPEDFKGLRAGSISSFAEAFSVALGMSFKVVPFGETFTAMQTGVIDVYANAPDTQTGVGLADLKNLSVIDHPVYLDNCLAIINLDKWNSIPKHLQDLMLDVQWVMEKEAGKKMEAFNANQRQILIDKGAKPVTFSAADAKRFTDLAYAAEWDKMQRLHPDITAKVKGMLTK